MTATNRPGLGLCACSSPGAPYTGGVDRGREDEPQPLLGRQPPRRDDWTETRWTVIATLAEREDPAWEASWTHLVDHYRPPMERYVRRLLIRLRRTRVSEEEVAEYVQGFLAECACKNSLATADAERGRFRAFIQTLLKRYLHRRHRHATARKRNPGPGRATLEIQDYDLVDETTPDDRAELAEFDRGWVKVAIDRALERLGEAHVRYQVIVEDLLATDGEGSPDLAERVETTPGHLSVIRYRARRRFRDLFAEELAATVGDPDAFQEEWRALAPYMP